MPNCRPSSSPNSASSQAAVQPRRPMREGLGDEQREADGAGRASGRAAARRGRRQQRERRGSRQRQQRPAPATILPCTSDLRRAARRVVFRRPQAAPASAGARPSCSAYQGSTTQPRQQAAQPTRRRRARSRPSAALTRQRARPRSPSAAIRRLRSADCAVLREVVVDQLDRRRIRAPRGGSGVALFDGTWNCLACAPSFCASGVSAQS